MARIITNRGTPEPHRPPPVPPGAGVARRWRFRRDLVIYLANRRNGLSQRLLADVFDLPRSRIAAIVKEFSQYDGATDRREASPEGGGP